ncbi:DNA-processing protein DprA [Collinsella sp. zg1085]|uniref:DNA-processing protein DprA n=1 Tax=Collinsella sp. zg1085 TaxID=2844380 RepID=UPI001C0CD1B8|nr:DNA-processing protein DprA [Collinsella sp. zg1085]QWT17040.1 DNA-processing protein DprA [Collinsella sp. zg1085]
MSSDYPRHELAISDETYPSSVRDLMDAPPVLYVRGNVDVLHEAGLAIVGARLATPYGIAIAEMAARVAAESNIVVISGGARGCDCAAGLAALKAGGKHIAVLGCGADVVYPRSSRRLFDQTLEQGGAIVSLDPWGQEPRRWAFPRRNRIIAALAKALLVTEAGMPSGTFTTAEAAIELERELLAVPGSILSKLSRGSNYLIATGATCIADEDDLEMAISRIFEVLRFSRPTSQTTAQGTQAIHRLMEALIASPLHIEEVAQILSQDVQASLLVVSELMVQGVCERLLDGRISLTTCALHAQGHISHNSFK